MYEDVLNVVSLIKKYDEEVANLIEQEQNRQKNCINLIASENLTSPAVMAAMGSVLTNKYAEGRPNERFYGGCQFVDEIENLAINRAKKLFNCNFVNVQPHSGSSANAAVYYAFLEPNDTALALSLNDGGHISHGCKFNSSGKLYNFIHYNVDKKTNLIDYDHLKKIAEENKPKLIVAGASSYPRLVDFEAVSEIAKKVGAIFLADIAHTAGFVCTNLHPSPVGFADVITTTTHKTLRGPRGGLILCNDPEIAEKVDRAVFPGTQGGFSMHIIAAKAVCFKEASTQQFKEYQQNIIKNSKKLAEELLNQGFNVLTKGTDNHLVLIDLKNFNMTGKELEDKLDKINITTNKNTIPNDKLRASITSGLRVGTPAITTRGFKEQEMKDIAKCIFLAASNFEKNKEIALTIVKSLLDKHPIY